MRVMVCLKPVPEPGSVKVDPETHTLKRESATLILNPADRFALEAAVRLKEKTGAEVVGVMMGPPNAAPLLKEAYACGADRVFLLSDRAFAGADTLATSYVLAQAAKKLGPFELVLCGKVSLDGETAQVGPELAAWLDWPSVIWIKSLAPEEGRLRVVRLTDDGEEEVLVKLPAVVTVEPETMDARPPSLRRLLEIMDQEVPVLSAADLEADEALIGLSGSPTRVLDVYTPTYEGKKEFLSGPAEEVVNRLVSLLRERGLI